MSSSKSAMVISRRERSDRAATRTFREGALVLVFKEGSDLSWSAKIVMVQEIEVENGRKVTMYRVHYTGWGSRFDEWVEGALLSSATPSAIEAKEARFEERMSSFVADAPEIFSQRFHKLLAATYLHKVSRSGGLLRTLLIGFVVFGMGW